MGLYLGSQNIGGTTNVPATTADWTNGATGAVTRPLVERLSEVLSVKDFGAKGDGTTDDTAAIQATIDAATTAFATGAVVHIPTGRYRITSTITFPNLSGGGVIGGDGIYAEDPFVGNRKGPSTLIYWDGAAGGTMVAMDGGMGWTIANMTFVGKLNSTDVTQAGIGYLCTGISNAGSGVSRFDSVAWANMDTGCQHGQNLGDAGNDADFVWNQCMWKDATTAVLINVVQGLNYNFFSPTAVRCTTFVHAAKGGSILINQLNTALCGGTGTNDWVFRLDAPSTNSGNLTITNWRAEQDTKQLVQAWYGKVSISGLTETSSNQAITQFKIRGATVSIRDSRLVTSNATNPTFDLDYGAGAQKGGLFLERVLFSVATFTYGEWFKHSNGNDPVPLKVTDSQYDGSAAIQFPLPPINSHLHYGPVTGFTQTVGTTTHPATLDGLSPGVHSNTCQIPTDTVWIIDVKIVGWETTGTGNAAGHRRVMVRNAGGTVSLIGTSQTVGTDIDPGAWGLTDPTINTANTAIQYLPKAVSGKTINWRVTFEGRFAGAV